jgi:hypothetical protein
MSEASAFVTVAMAAIRVVVAAAFVVGVGGAAGQSSATRPVLVVMGWMALTSALARAGVLGNFETKPPPLFVVLAGVVAAAVWAARSRLAARMSELPLAALVGFHAFRLPLELVMHQAASEGAMPPQMTFGDGYNYDIVTGATAVVVAALVSRGRAPQWLVWAWNVMGLGLVLTISAIGVASTPMFEAFGAEAGRVNTFVTVWPFVWLPAVLVSAAIAGHVVIFRRLWADRRR